MVARESAGALCVQDRDVERHEILIADAAEDVGRDVRGARELAESRLREVAVRLYLGLQVGGLLLGSGNGIGTSDETARWRALVRNGNECACELRWISGLLTILGLPLERIARSITVLIAEIAASSRPAFCAVWISFGSAAMPSFGACPENLQMPRRRLRRRCPCSIEYDGELPLKINCSLLSVVLHD